MPNKTRQFGSYNAGRMSRTCLLFWLAMPALMSCSDHRRSSEPEKSAMASQATQTIYRDINDWLLACSNLRDCTVQSVKDNLAFTGKLTITREPGPNGRVRLSIARIGLQDGLDLRDLEVDGRPMTFHFNWQAQPDSFSASLKHEHALRLIKALASAEKLSFGRGDLRSSISLDGFSRSVAGMNCSATIWVRGWRQSG